MVADLDIIKIRMFESIRNDRGFELLVIKLHYGQADPIDGDRTFGYDKRTKLGGKSPSKYPIVS